MDIHVYRCRHVSLCTHASIHSNKHPDAGSKGLHGTRPGQPSVVRPTRQVLHVRTKAHACYSACHSSEEPVPRAGSRCSTVMSHTGAPVGAAGGEQLAHTRDSQPHSPRQSVMQLERASRSRVQSCHWPGDAVSHRTDVQLKRSVCHSRVRGPKGNGLTTDTVSDSSGSRLTPHSRVALSYRSRGS